VTNAIIRLWTQWARLRFFWRRMRLHIPRDALVLDIGSGDNPHGRADILCDRHIVAQIDRPGAFFLDRPLVVGDAHHLPFRDGAFDYVICSHVLEHTDRPEELLAELMRVARAGYIETPSSLSEKLGGKVFHRVYVDLENGTLAIRHKPGPVFDSQLHVTFHGFWRRNTAFMFFYWRHVDLHFTRMEWRNRIPFRIIGAPSVAAWPADEEDQMPDLEALARLPRSRITPKWRLKRLLYQLAGQWHPPRRIDLQSILACPLCRAPLQLAADRATCGRCPASFPVCAGIPVLLEEALGKPVAEGALR